MTDITPADSSLASVEAWIDDMPHQLRLAAAYGGTQITLTPLGCVRVARRLEAPPPPAPIVVQLDPDAADRTLWLRIVACLLIIAAAGDAALPLARWIAAL